MILEEFINGNLGAYGFMKGATLLTVTLALSACNGDGSDFSSSSASSSSGANADPEGIWTGVDSITGQEGFAIIEASGAFDILLNDGTQYTGQAVVTGTSLVASDQGWVQVAGTSPFANSATLGDGTISGVLAAGASIIANTTFTPAGGTKATGTLSLTFDALYNTGSSLAAISGTYINQAGTQSVTISSGGVIFGSQNSVTSCVINGQINLINASYDAYAVSYTYSNCGTGAFNPLNGVLLSGVGVLNTGNSPTQLIIGVTGGSQYGDVLQLNRQ